MGYCHVKTQEVTLILEPDTVDAARSTTEH
jgi:hypothetical protein